MKTLVIVPTFNERENISLLIPQILNLAENLEVLVVDDNSPDGTSDIVREYQKKSAKVHLIVREKKNGLGKAYLHGFKWALENNYDLIGQMDADFSHRLEDLKNILNHKNEADVLIGSRWVSGGSTLNWSPFRKLISLGGSLYSRWILKFPIKDWTGGFNMWKKNVLQNIELDKIESEGYSFQIEMKYRSQKCGFKVLEVPIVFEERRSGQSKMSAKIFIEALYRVWSIRRI